MQVLRTVVWVVILIALALFAAFNWVPIEIQIWQNLVLETKLPVLIGTAFLLGLVPMWLLHRTARWRLERKIDALEAAQRSLVAARAHSESTAATSDDAA